MKWGILGHGLIAPQFIKSLHAIPTQQLYAIGSRSNATELAKRYPKVKIYDAYEALCKDEEVDIIYVSTPHNFHKEHTLLALTYGKHVICEKPIGISADEVKEMQEMARKEKCFLMEGMWTRFLPAYRKAMGELHAGIIGKCHWLQADFSFYSPYEPDKRWLNPALAGGSVYDVGVYPLAMAMDLFGNTPENIQAQASMAGTGVDAHCSIQLQYKAGPTAQLFSGIDVETPHTAQIGGEKGSMQLPSFWKASSYKTSLEGKEEKYTLPYIRTGYYHETIAAIECIEAGLLECPIFSFEDSLRMAEIVDEVLSQIGYPDVSRP
ncbi:MAG: Gfo/Idh/MocA family oxidoreductase [Bacteroidota bacterium]